MVRYSIVSFKASFQNGAPPLAAMHPGHGSPQSRARHTHRGGRPPREVSEQITHRIIEAARILFLRNGYDGSSMAAGFMQWDNAFFPWTLNYDEIDMIL